MNTWYNCKDCKYYQTGSMECGGCVEKPSHFKPDKKENNMPSEKRHSERAKYVFRCINCKNYGNGDICEKCVVGTNWESNETNDYEYIEHPEHYQMKDNTYEPYKVINAWNLDFNLGSVLKYIARAGKKPGEDTIRDLNKCKEYIDFEIMKLNKEKKITD